MKNLNCIGVASLVVLTATLSACGDGGNSLNGQWAAGGLYCGESNRIGDMIIEDNFAQHAPVDKMNVDGQGASFEGRMVQMNGSGYRVDRGGRVTIEDDRAFFVLDSVTQYYRDYNGNPVAIPNSTFNTSNGYKSPTLSFRLAINGSNRADLVRNEAQNLNATAYNPGGGQSWMNPYPGGFVGGNQGNGSSYCNYNEVESFRFTRLN